MTEEGTSTLSGEKQEIHLFSSGAATHLLDCPVLPYKDVLYHYLHHKSFY
jgi:hypothetical protein